MVKLQLSQELMRNQESTGRRQGGLVIRDTLWSWKVAYLILGTVHVFIHSYLYCEVSSNKMVNDDPHVLCLHQLNYRKCSLSETLISAMDDINTALIVFPWSFQFAILPHFTFLNPGIKHPGSSCICSLLSRKESRRVGVIQTFFKLQFIFPEL